MLEAVRHFITALRQRLDEATVEGEAVGASGVIERLLNDDVSAMLHEVEALLPSRDASLAEQRALGDNVLALRHQCEELHREAVAMRRAADEERSRAAALQHQLDLRDNVVANLRKHTLREGAHHASGGAANLAAVPFELLDAVEVEVGRKALLCEQQLEKASRSHELSLARQQAHFERIVAAKEREIIQLQLQFRNTLRSVQGTHASGVDRLQREVERLRREATEASAVAHQQAQERSRVEVERAVHAERLARDAAVAAVRGECRALEERGKNLSNQVDHLQQVNDALSAHASLLQRTLRHALVVEQPALVNDRVQEVQEVLAAAEARVAAGEEASTQLAKRFADLERASAGQIAALQSELAAMQKELGTLRHDVQHKDAALREANTMRLHLQQQLAEARKDAVLLQQEVDVLRRQSTEVVEEEWSKRHAAAQKEWMDKHTELQLALDAARRDANALGEAARQHDARAAEIAGALQSVQRELLESQLHERRSRGELDELQRQYGALVATSAELREQLAKAVADAAVAEQRAAERAAAASRVADELQQLREAQVHAQRGSAAHFGRSSPPFDSEKGTVASSSSAAQARLPTQQQQQPQRTPRGSSSASSMRRTSAINAAAAAAAASSTGVGSGTGAMGRRTTAMTVVSPTASSSGASLRNEGRRVSLALEPAASTERGAAAERQQPQPQQQQRLRLHQQQHRSGSELETVLSDVEHASSILISTPALSPSPEATGPGTVLLADKSTQCSPCPVEESVTKENATRELEARDNAALRVVLVELRVDIDQLRRASAFDPTSTSAALGSTVRVDLGGGGEAAAGALRCDWADQELIELLPAPQPSTSWDAELAAQNTIFAAEVARRQLMRNRLIDAFKAHEAQQVMRGSQDSDDDQEDFQYYSRAFREVARAITPQHLRPHLRHANPGASAGVAGVWATTRHAAAAANGGGGGAPYIPLGSPSMPMGGREMIRAAVQLGAGFRVVSGAPPDTAKVATTGKRNAANPSRCLTPRVPVCGNRACGATSVDPASYFAVRRRIGLAHHRHQQHQQHQQHRGGDAPCRVEGAAAVPPPTAPSAASAAPPPGDPDSEQTLMHQAADDEDEMRPAAALPNLLVASYVEHSAGTPAPEVARETETFTEVMARRKHEQQRVRRPQSARTARTASRMAPPSGFVQ